MGDAALPVPEEWPAAFLMRGCLLATILHLMWAAPSHSCKEEPHAIMLWLPL